MVGSMCSLLHYGTDICQYAMLLIFFIVSAHSFLIFFFNLLLINETEWSMISACPSLTCSFDKGDIERTNS